MTIDVNELEKAIATPIKQALDARQQRIMESINDEDLPKQIVPKYETTIEFDGKRSKWDHEKKEWKPETLFKIVLCRLESYKKMAKLQTTCKACQHRKGRYCTSKDHIRNNAIYNALQKDQRQLDQAFRRSFCR